MFWRNLLSVFVLVGLLLCQNTQENNQFRGGNFCFGSWSRTAWQASQMWWLLNGRYRLGEEATMSFRRQEGLIFCMFYLTWVHSDWLWLNPEPCTYKAYAFTLNLTPQLNSGLPGTKQGGSTFEDAFETLRQHYTGDLILSIPQMAKIIGLPLTLYTRDISNCSGGFPTEELACDCNLK